MNKPVYTVVLGAGGYVGGELLRLITAHPTFELAAAVSGQPLADTFGHLSQVLAKETFAGSDDWLKTIPASSNIALFSAAPHGASAEIIAAALGAAQEHGHRIHVVDCSADFRYREQADWESIYGAQHGAPALCRNTLQQSIRRMLATPAASQPPCCSPACHS